MTVPGDLAVDATGPDGAAVGFTVTVTDNVPEGVQHECAPGSGSVFPIGTTTVACSATDAAGKTASASFEVHVRGAAAQLADLVDKVRELVGLPPLEAALRARLERIVDALAAGRTATVCAGLHAFATLVRTVPGGLMPAERGELLADTARIRAVLGCV